MGFFKKPEKVKDAQYYGGVAFAIYGLYLMKNSPTDPMQKRLGSYFKSIVNFYDQSFGGTYFTNLYLAGCMGNNFAANWNSADIKNVMNNNTEKLGLVKKSLEEYTFRNGPKEDILQELYNCVGVSYEANPDKNKELETWLVKCVYDSILDRFTVERPSDEREDAFPEAVVLSLYGGLMLCCHRELINF